MKPVLHINQLSVTLKQKRILQKISLDVGAGQVHAVMGPNGSGKSTLLYALMGHPAYTIQNKELRIMNKDINNLSTEERAKAGLYLALQSPVSIPGVTVMNLLRTARQEPPSQKSRPPARHNPIFHDVSLTGFISQIKTFAKQLHMDPSLLTRGIHDGFSGGEKKKIEMLQALVLKPKIAMFDEIDTGLDVDALKIVAKGIKTLASMGTGILVVTHYQRILKYIKPDKVHVLVGGSIVRTGSSDLARTIEEQGYATYAH